VAKSRPSLILPEMVAIIEGFLYWVYTVYRYNMEKKHIVVISFSSEQCTVDSCRFVISPFLWGGTRGTPGGNWLHGRVLRH